MNYKNPTNFFLILCIVGSCTCNGKTGDGEGALARYVAAGPQEKYPRGLRVSEHYRVLAKPAADETGWNAKEHLTVTYEAWPDYVEPQAVPDPYKDITVHFAQVDADQRIRFRVEMIGETVIERLKVNPSRYTEMRESLQSGSDWIEFEVDPVDLTKHILVEINDPLDSPALDAQKMAEEGDKAGTLSSGMDCWLKKVDYPIINSWYKKSTSGEGSYHKDTGEGLDNFHVGSSRGCGGLGVYIDEELYTSKNFTAWNILANGPLQTRFTLDYEDWKTPEGSYFRVEGDQSGSWI